MGFTYRKRILLREEVLKKCTVCAKVYLAENDFCPNCGSKLISEKTKVYANMGKSGITLLSYVLPNGTTINSKGSMSIPMGNGISYTTRN